MPTAGDSTLAILLRSVDYRDADRILTLFTATRGRVSAIARGARSSRRRFAGVLEPFSVIEVRLTGRSSGLAQLAEAKLVVSYPGILASLARMNAAGAALEDLRSLLPEQAPEPDIFDATVSLLDTLDTCPDGELALRHHAFLARALSLSGLAANLRACGICGRRPGDGQPALFDPVAGHLVCRACGGGPLRLSAVARRLVIAACDEGADLKRGEATPQDVAEMGQVLRATLRAHGAGQRQ